MRHVERVLDRSRKEKTVAQDRMVAVEKVRGAQILDVSWKLSQ